MTLSAVRTDEDEVVCAIAFKQYVFFCFYGSAVVGLVWTRAQEAIEQNNTPHGDDDDDSLATKIRDKATTE